MTLKLHSTKLHSTQTEVPDLSQDRHVKDFQPILARQDRPPSMHATAAPGLTSTHPLGCAGTPRIVQAGLTARARPEARPETRAANLDNPAPVDEAELARREQLSVPETLRAGQIAAYKSLVATTQISDLHAQLCDVLARAEAWWGKLSAMPDFAVASVGGEEHGAAIAHLRTRAASTLINVAMFGAFSSGKSFLVSGLQGQLEVIEVPGGEGLPAEKFIGLLPSSPEPTNACPTQIVPVEEDAGFDTSGRGFLRVRLTDSPEWEDVGNSQAPAVVAAYVMDRADVSNRLSAHYRREVAEVEILLQRLKGQRLSPSWW